MDRRTLLALLLTAIVIVATPFLFPAPRRPRPVPADTTRPAPRDTTTPVPAEVAPRTRPLPARPPTSVEAPSTRPETTVVRTNRATFVLLSPGGTPASVTLPEYRSLRPGASRANPVTLVEASDRVMRLRLAGSRDTIALDTIAFRAGPQRREGNSVVQVLTSASGTIPMTLTYRFPVDSFAVHIDGSIGSGSSQSQSWRLLVTLPTRIRSDEADVNDDTRHLAVAYRVRSSEVTTASFRQMDTLTTRVDTGSFRWVAMRNKYFVVAAIPEGRDSLFRAVALRGGPRTGPDATAAYVTAMVPTTGGRFSLKLYTGPQSWDHLRRTAPDLENVNPYGGWLHGLVQPFATIVMRMLLWMHNTLAVGYGLVLVIFAVMVRLLLWPMNQSAMRSSMKLQRIQPQMAELQKKYRNDPEKQRDAMMKLYQEHGMSPFSPILGCLPMLLPMPILYALYFVFQNTIELRGVSFLWLPDLSLRDPYFITPLFMGVSMFILSWIGMKGMPPSPQGKMMSYVMPVMFTALFWNFASGLNLYYAVQNVAALPQQLLLSREKQRANPKAGARKTDSGSGRGTRNEGS